MPNQIQKAELERLKKLIHASLERLKGYHENDGPLVLIESEAKLVVERCSRFFQVLYSIEIDNSGIFNSDELELDPTSEAATKWARRGTIVAMLLSAWLVGWIFVRLFHWILK